MAFVKDHLRRTRLCYLLYNPAIMFCNAITCGCDLNHNVCSGICSLLGCLQLFNFEYFV